MSSATYLAAFISLGPAEIGMLLLVMIFVFGPKRIPEIGESIGKALSSYRKATTEEPEPAKDQDKGKDAE